jgi:error-prone DNA polymerase
MSCLPRLKPKKFYDIVVQVAIIRPGPIVGKMLHPYLNRRQGYEEAACLHPSLEQVLKRTLGVPLFQEQLLKIAMIAANFTGGEAEELRRAMGFKRSEARMRDIETRLRSGMTANGILGETQDRIVQSITSFALYGFPESHAASFALIAYASAYLKCHYLAAFMAAMLNNQPMGFYHPATLVKDAQRHGLHFRPVDVQQSSWKCTIEGDVVRLGLNYVRGVRKETAEAIVASRPFSSINDMVRRVPGLRKPELRMLAEVGALNSMGGNRRDALWEAERALRPAGSLFEAVEAAEPPSPLAPMTAPERIRADFYGTGVTIGPHPMKLYREGLRKRGVVAAEDLQYEKHGRLVRVAGCVICRQRPGTAKGFMFLSLEDETGIANAIVEPDLFDAFRETLVTAPYLLVEGILQNQQGAISVKLNRAEPLNFEVAEVPSHDFR